jgi:thioredoxin reductase (NADPH)
MNDITEVDIMIIGGGPAGLSAAINAASEGLSTILCDSTQRFGGQAGSSSLIENFLGFPDGVSGELLTKLAIKQAAKFNVDFKAPFNATRIMKKSNDTFDVCSDDEEIVNCKVVLLAMGVNYKSLNARNIARFIGCGVSYGSPSLSENYSGKIIGVIGGANSAGQAAHFLSSCIDCKVVLIIRGDKIEDKMSRYLIEKIEKSPNIEVLTHTEVIDARGGTDLEGVIIKTKDGNKDIDMERLFILIGAKPKTVWLKDVVVLDDNGFILTGNEVSHHKIWTRGGRKWNKMNGIYKPLSSETVPGIFAAGDVRASSVKRVSNAIGEGARAINDIHQYLAKWKELHAL